MATMAMLKLTLMQYKLIIVKNAMIATTIRHDGKAVIFE